MFSSRRGAAHLAVVLLLLSACGGGGDTARLTSEELAEKVNGICVKYFSNLADQQPSSVDEIADFLADVITNGEAAAAELRKLAPPQEAEDKYRSYLLSVDLVLSAAEEAKEGLEEGRLSAMDEFAARSEELAVTERDIERELGFDRCSASDDAEAAVEPVETEGAVEPELPATDATPVPETATETETAQSPAPEAQGTGWAGEWLTTYGQMTLTQTGPRVSGTYETRNGRLVGTADGRRLKGTWREGPTAGPFEFTMSADGSTFRGHWSYAGDPSSRQEWVGSRS